MACTGPKKTVLFQCVEERQRVSRIACRVSSPEVLGALVAERGCGMVRSETKAGDRYEGGEEAEVEVSLIRVIRSFSLLFYYW